MAEKRMFSKKIVDTDAFLDMPATARLLYYDLAMRADDDGFVGSPRGIMRSTGATNDDMNILLMRGFVISFETGVIVIRHWRLHNYIQKDRYKPTDYVNEKALLSTDDKGVYSLDTECIQPVSNPCPQIKDRYRDRLDSDKREDNNTLTLTGSSVCATAKPRKFTPPSVEEVREYCSERGNNVDPDKFVDFYDSKGWMVGKNKMKDWRAAVRTWERTAPKTTNETHDRYANLRNLLEANKDE